MDATTTQTTQTKATRKATRRGFTARCIKCNEAEVRISLGNTADFACSACSEEFTAADVRLLIAEWSAVLAWVETAPEL